MTHSLRSVIFAQDLQSRIELRMLPTHIQRGEEIDDIK